MLMQRKRAGRRGAALVETALVLILFVVALVGIVDFAQFLYLHQALANRVRSVTRTAAIRSLTPTQVKNLVCYDTHVGPSGNVNGFMGLVPDNVDVQLLDISSSAKRVVVTVSGLHYPRLSPFLPGPGTILPLRVTATLETP